MQGGMHNGGMHGGMQGGMHGGMHGGMQPGMMQPGMMQPGMMQPGMQPGMHQVNPFPQPTNPIVKGVADLGSTAMNVLGQGMGVAGQMNQQFNNIAARRVLVFC